MARELSPPASDSARIGTLLLAIATVLGFAAWMAGWICRIGRRIYRRKSK
jgi:hypothetical protein